MSTFKNVWGIHGGRSGEADSVFLQKNVVAVGWVKMGDASKLKSSRDAYKAAYAQGYPDKNPLAVPTMAGQLFRFVNEIQVGDLIAYPSRTERFTLAGSKARISTTRRWMNIFPISVQ